MEKLIFRGAQVLLDGRLTETDVRIAQGRIDAVGRGLDGGDVMRVEGYLLPGLIDEHIHGIAGHDTMDGVQAVLGMAKQLVYSALNIKADEALRIGLVNAVYPQAELMENVLKLAGKIAKNAPIAVRNCKKAINDGISLPIEKAVEVEEKLFGDCFETHDQVEGMSCFLSREKPKPKAVFTNN